jgi:hypothetical protein
VEDVWNALRFATTVSPSKALPSLKVTSSRSVRLSVVRASS